MKILSENKIFVFFLIVFTFLLYSQSLEYKFIHWDDDKQITANSRIKTISSENISYNFKYERYTAISLYSYMIDYKLWGQNPFAFRMVNVLLHVLNVLLVFFLISLLTANRKIAFFTALLFACHPLRVESVVWISERKDVLFTFWGLLSLISYRKYIVTENKVFFLTAFLLALLSAFSKIQGILIPFTFFLIDYWYNRKLSLRMAMEKIFLLLFIFFIYNKWAIYIAILYIIWFFIPETKKKKLFPPVTIKRNAVVVVLIATITVSFLVFIYISNFFGIWEENSPSMSAQFDFFDRIFLATYSFSHYIIKLIAPIKLSAVYIYPDKTAGMLPALYYFSSIVILPVLLFVYYIFKKKNIAPVYIFGLAFFVLNISIVLHILPIEGRLVVADRYTYLAYTGLFFIVAYSIVHYIKNVKFQWLIIIAAVGLLSFRNYTRQPVWENTGSLFTDVLENDSNIAFAVNNLAVYEMYNNRLDNALLLINKSVALDSTDPMSWYNQGLVLFNLKRPAEAIDSYNSMMKHAYSSEDTALAYNDMGQCYISMRNPEEGVNHLKKSLLISDKIPSAYNNLGWYFYNTGQADSARIMFAKAISLNPDYAEALNNMGSLLFTTGKTDSALYYFNRSIITKPTYSLAYNNRGYYFLMKNDLNGALQSFNQAIEVDPGFIEAYLNRAWIYYNRKEYDKAINDYNYILGKDSTIITAYTNRGFSLLMQGKTESAIKDFSESIRFKPSDPEMYANRGRAYMQLKEFEKAVADYSISVSIKETDIYYQFRAIAYYELKKYGDAERDLKESIRLKPDNADNYYYMGRLLTEAGNKINACGFYSKAASMGHQKAKAEMDKCL